MVINVEIAFAFHLERHAAVLCERCKHLHHVLNQLFSPFLKRGKVGAETHDTYMVKEPDTSADIDLLLGDTRDMVEINRARDMRLAGGPFHRSNTFRHGVGVSCAKMKAEC